MTRDEMWKALHARGYMPYVPTLQTYYRQWFDDEGGVVQFPLYDFRGMLAGYQTYRPGAPKQHSNPKMARYFTRARQQLCWGTYLPLRPGPIFLTEAIFKSVALHRAGYNSWSVLGSNISAPLKQQLDLLPYDFRCIGDGDAAGIQFSRTFANGLTTGAKDLDEMLIWQMRDLIGETK